MMRTFIFGMPSSGATFVAWQLAQKPGCVGVLDLCALDPVPLAEEFGDLDVVLKVNSRRKKGYLPTIERFRPDRIVIVTRDDATVAESLRRRQADASDPMIFLRRGEVSLRRMRRRVRDAMVAGLHDKIVRYEDVAECDRNLKRGLLEIAFRNHEQVAWCRENRPQRWGFGGLRVPGATEEDMQLLMRVVRYWGYEVEGRATKFSAYFARHGLPSVAAGVAR